MTWSKMVMLISVDPYGRPEHSYGVFIDLALSTVIAEKTAGDLSWPEMTLATWRGVTGRNIQTQAVRSTCIPMFESCATAAGRATWPSTQPSTSRSRTGTTLTSTFPTTAWCPEMRPSRSRQRWSPPAGTATAYSKQIHVWLLSLITIKRNIWRAPWMVTHTESSAFLG